MLLTVDYLSTFSLAAQQNSYPLLRGVRLELPDGDTEDGDAVASFRNLVIRLNAFQDIFLEEEWFVDEIHAGQAITLQQRPLSVPQDLLFKLTEEMQVPLTFSVFSKDSPGHVLVKEEIQVTILPANFWGGETRQPELLAAFVKPNGLYVESLVRQVTELLEKGGYGRSADGYQSNTREKPYVMTAALWNVVFAERISYVTPPQSFARQGQRIRLAADISTSKLGACLDTSLLFASCLEMMGLNPVVALGREHAFVGVWLIDDCFPVLTNDDPMDLRKRVDARDLILFETTLVTNASPVTFEQAKSHARELIGEDREHEFVYVIDIKQARSRKIRPLSTIEERPEESVSDERVTLSLPPVPPLPAVAFDEQVVEETPESRVDSWQRKLLDLTKRNALLALKDRAVSIRLFCPAIGSMEDSLAKGVTFRFLSAEESPLNDNERSEEVFRLQHGSDLHQEYALEQLDKHVLIANMSSSKLEKNSINLLRKAKNDLEEGGSNTLYLALGMLRWKENPEDDRSYRAPLILIPAELTRRSARAPIKVRQLPEEPPIFNLTLIEFLYKEHKIDLNRFRDNLPEDESGVDVHSIWSSVRAAVAEQPGFEVVEELVLASFSFAKYLMWKDLKDRVEDLKENPFVEHLIDRPQDAYHQESRFISREEVDQKIDPEKVFTPLNCDSSQLVAVEASGESQDFVLEGPPGTGKSETIANIICNNIARGRKVLFVAEKMAALHVVYRRMEKVGLDHLCLELHSNKANKKAVLEQLKAATDRREEAESEGWIQSVNQLKEKRDRLNGFVTALHKKSDFGISARDAIAREVLYKHDHLLDLGWPLGFAGAPVSDTEGVEKLLETARACAIAYSDVSSLDAALFRTVSARQWSNAWQSKAVDCLRRYHSAISDMYSSATSLANSFNIDEPIDTPKKAFSASSLASLVQYSESASFSYLVNNSGKEALENLANLAEKKALYDTKLADIDHSITPKILADTPTSEWVLKYRSSKDSWVKRIFARFSINSEAKKLGYSKFADLDIVDDLAQAAEIHKDIEELSVSFEADGIWSGWDTSSESLHDSAKLGGKFRRSLLNAMRLTDDPGSVVSAIKSKLVDGREFIESSKVVTEKMTFSEHWEKYIAVAQEAKDFQLEFSEDQRYEDLSKAIPILIDSAAKFKPWSEWLSAKDSASRLQLDALTRALESRTVLPENAEGEVMTAFCKWLAPQLIDESEELREFKASSHEQTIVDFRQLDAHVAETTSAYVSAIAAKAVPDPFAKDSPAEFGVLARELQKKTRHKPVRTLFEEMGERLLDLCPCMMMSPLSVAQFLPTHFNGFDLVVFDEASQMTTWDSVGAIARGKNVIVVGDPKQMPPTSFFSSAVDVDDPDEEDMESILDQALAARLPHLRLKGHYRSRHETLIAFSNSKYYENSLVTYPSCDTKESAVSLHRVNGVYSKGKGRNNPIEAKAVVEEIVRRLTDPDQCMQSIGVVTLNTEQQRTVEDLLDEARREHPAIETYFHTTDDYDGVFVKNLESVQGDERDVIMLSLGYGPIEAGSKTMSMNFGPLNKAGGERRLNVAITRATTEVVIFSSFDSSMIDLTRTSSVAVEHLKHYLEFAEKGPIALAEQATAEYGVDQFDSDFEQAVALALREKGWKVQTQIGVSKFRIDLGIVHPDQPGVYLAGVECDGATYHSSPSARDRDRVRHIVLENLGWRLIRLWSTDYFQDRDEAITRVDSALSEILQDDRAAAEKLKEKAKDAEQEDADQLDESLVPIDIEPAVDFPRDDAGVQETVVQGLAQAETTPSDQQQYDQSRYFDSQYRPVLAELAREILSSKNGITLHSLALEIANRHGLSRTSKKQLRHILSVIKPWAGITRDGVHKPVVWLRPDDVVDEIAWRGLNAFGKERSWSEIPYPEALGLARLSLKEAPDNPVMYICETFKLQRRHENTLEQFQSWVDSVSESDGE